ncbi:hypothetical protein FRC16_006898, partial [Serendipita sp. 398]
MSSSPRTTITTPSSSISLPFPNITTGENGAREDDTVENGEEDKATFEFEPDKDEVETEEEEDEDEED